MTLLNLAISWVLSPHGHGIYTCHVGTAAGRLCYIYLHPSVASQYLYTANEYLIWNKPKLNTPPQIDVGASHRTIRSAEKGVSPDTPIDILANH